MANFESECEKKKQKQPTTLHQTHSIKQKVWHEGCRVPKKLTS
jgi:hypothetical protein